MGKGIFGFLSSLINGEEAGYDRETTNSDGTTYYGKDDGYGTTTWYNEDGEAEATSETPEYDDENQHCYHDDDYDPYYNQHEEDDD